MKEILKDLNKAFEKNIIKHFLKIKADKTLHLKVLEIIENTENTENIKNPL